MQSDFLEDLSEKVMDFCYPVNECIYDEDKLGMRMMACMLELLESVQNQLPPIGKVGLFSAQQYWKTQPDELIPTHKFLISYISDNNLN